MRALCKQAQNDNSIYLLTADQGYGLLNRFQNAFPDRFINVGIAEQNMIGIAAGLADAGKKVVVFSSGNFPTMRCLEHIRNLISYRNANVKIVAIGAGLEYGLLGFTQFALEDIGIMRPLPNMTIVAPGDPIEAELATKCIIQRNGPCYMRLSEEDVIKEINFLTFELGNALWIKKVGNGTLITTGGMLRTTLTVQKLLKVAGIDVAVLHIHTIKPIDEKAIVEAAKSGYIFSIEEHSKIGGLGSAIAEVLLREKARVEHFEMFGVSYTLAKNGSRTFLLGEFGLTPEKLAEKIRQAITQKS